MEFEAPAGTLLPLAKGAANAVFAFLALSLLALFSSITNVFQDWGHAAESFNFRAQMRQSLLSFGDELFGFDFYALPVPEWASIALDYSKVWLPLAGGVLSAFLLWQAARNSATTRAQWEGR